MSEFEFGWGVTNRVTARGMVGKDGEPLWLTVAEAAKRLGLRDTAVRWLVNHDRLRLFEEDDGTWMVPADEVAECGSRIAELGLPKHVRSGTVGQRDRGTRQRQVVVARRPAEGPDWYVSVAEAAERLGVSKRQVYHLIAEGDLQGVREGRFRWILRMDVELYAQAQAHWPARGGRWTAGGERLAKREAPVERMEAEGPGRECGEYGKCGSGGDEDDAGWVRVERAAEWLGVHASRVTQMWKEGKLRRRKVMPERWPGSFHYAYSAADLMRLMAEREAEAWRKAMTPGEQAKSRVRRPLFRREMVAPEGDTLITRAEAAHILGVSPTRVSVLVHEGRLFGWSREPGRPGVPLMLSALQVRRYAQDGERLKRRWARFGRRRAPSGDGRWDGKTPWAGSGFGKGVERTHGAFLSARQAARALGIAPKTVLAMRRRGRLQGYRRPDRGGWGNRWWFFRRSDVERLLVDPAYRERHARAKPDPWGLEARSTDG